MQRLTGPQTRDERTERIEPNREGDEMTTYETPGPVRLRLRLAAGEIDVHAADVTQTTVEITVLAGDPSAAAEIIQESRPTPDGGHQIRVEAPMRYRMFGRTPKFRFRLTVPSGAHLDARTASGAVATEGRLGDVEVKTASGDARIERAEGRLSASTASGSIEVGSTGGDAEVHTVSGPVHLGPVTGSVRLHGVSGRMEVLEARGSVRADTVSGDVAVERLGAGQTTIGSVSGRVRLAVESGLHVWMDLSSVSGRTTSDLTPDEAGSSAHRDAPARLDIKASTVSGNISITRASEAMPAAS
jgi:hypothetical protein